MSKQNPFFVQITQVCSWFCLELDHSNTHVEFEPYLEDSLRKGNISKYGQHCLGNTYRNDDYHDRYKAVQTN